MAGATDANDTRSSPEHWQMPALPRMCQAATLFQAGRLRHFTQAWRTLEPDEWVLQVITKGLKIRLTSEPPLTSTPVQWDAYGPHTEKGRALDLETRALIQKGAIEPVPENSPGFYSLLFLQPKKDPGEWRPILDLKPFNKFVHHEKFKMDTPDTVRAMLRRGLWCTSIDLKDAFFHVPVHRAHRKYLRFKTRLGTYQFTALPFGLKSAPATFTRIIKAVAAYARSRGVCVIHYLDDWLIFHEDRDVAAAQTLWLVKLAERLGFVINYSKSELTPTQTPTFIGMFLDLITATVYPAQHRIQNILELLTTWLHRRSHSAKKWQVVIGHMVSLERLVPRGRLHLRPFQNILASQWNQRTDDHSQQCVIYPELLPEVRWWMNQHNLEKGIPLETPVPEVRLFTDASNEGWGAHLNDLMVSGTWTLELANKHINFLELKAVDLALRHFQQQIAGRVIALMTDNTTVTAVIRNQGSTKSPELDALAREVILWTDRHNIIVMPRHVAGKLNVVADSLSRRGHTPTEWTLDASSVDSMWSVWGRPFVDMFATSRNAKLPTFVSPIPEETAWKVDALSFPWTGLFLYAFPPIILVKQVLQRVRLFDCRVILVAPWWPTQPWFPELLNLCIDYPRTIRVHPKLLRHSVSLQFHPNPDMFRLHAFLLSGRHSSSEALRQEWRTSLPDVGERVPRDSTTITGACGPIGASGTKLIPTLPL